MPGVYAAGDAVTEHLRSVANALGSGSRVAQRVVLDLVAPLGAQPVAPAIAAAA